MAAGYKILHCLVQVNIVFNLFMYVGKRPKISCSPLSYYSPWARMMVTHLYRIKILNTVHSATGVIVYKIKTLKHHEKCTKTTEVRGYDAF